MSVKLKYIPNILKYKGRKVEVIPFDKVEGKTILDCVKILGYPTTDIKAIINGKKVDLNSKVKKDTEIIITREPKFAAIAAFFTLGAFWVAVGTIIDIAYVVYSIVSAIVNKPRTGSFGGMGEGLDEGSPTYGWDGIRTIQDVGIVVPVIYGRHRVGGNIINAYIRTDGDKNYLNVLLALSEGEINSIGTILINDNPSANFDGISTTTKMGTNDQAMIPNFEDAHNLYDVNTNMTKDNAHVYTTVDSDVEGFNIYLQCPSGLYQQNTTGGIQEWSVTYKVEYKLHAAPSYTDLGSTTITAKSRTTLRRTYRKIGLTAGQYDIRVTKTSADSSLDPIMQGDLTWVQLDEVKLDDFRYPNTALLGIEALATDQLSGGMPNFTSLVEGVKVSIPDIKTVGGAAQDWEDYYYDDVNSKWKLLADDTELAWDDVTYVTKWSANPIWCIKDLLINTRYGLGEFIDSTDIDDALFLEMAKYCEEKVSDGEGGYEKRFQLNVVLDSATRALDAINQLCMTFRGMPFYSGGNVKIRIDKDETPVQLFTMGNIIKDSFKQSWKSQKDVPNVLEIQYLDEDKDYKQDTIAYIDEDALAAGDPMRKKTIRLFVTKISQVIREARYALKQAKYLNRAISFGASIDAIACQPGDLISVQHDVPQWGFGGRVKTGSTTTKVVLDQEVTLTSGTYKIRVHHNDDTIEEKTVSTGAGTTDEIEVVGDAFGFTPSAFDKYAIGLTGVVKKDFRIVSMKIDNKNEVQITAMEHNTSVYDDSAVTIPDNNYSSLTLTIPEIRNLALTERLVKSSDGTIETAIDVWWDKPDPPSTFVRTYYKGKVYISEDNSSWRYAGESMGTHFQIIGDIIDGVQYYIKVVTVTDDNREGTLSTAPSSNITPAGKSAVPSDVSSFLVNQSRDRLIFGWAEVSDVDIWGYEIRVGADWDSSQQVVFVQGNNHIRTDFRAGSSQSYWIKAVDTSGNYSETAKEAVITIDNIPFRNIINAYSEQTAWTGDKVNTETSGDNLILSAGELTGTYVTAEQDQGYIATFLIAIEVLTTISQGLGFDSDAGTKFDDSPTLRFTGEEIPGAATFEIRTSEDDITWTDYATYQAGDYKCRYFQIRMTLTRESIVTTLLCTQFDYLADLPDVDEMQDGEVSTAADGDEITFTKTFHEDPALNITILTGDGDYWLASGLDTTGVTIKLYQNDGTAKIGTFRVHVHGV